MNKIKILNKEFEVGDMVEIEKHSFTDDCGMSHTIKCIGYIHGIEGVDFSKRIQLYSEEWGGYEHEFEVEEEITSIKKLVYEQ